MFKFVNNILIIFQISAFFVLAVASVNAGGLPLASVLSASPVYASSPLLTRGFYSSPLLAPEALPASAPALTRAAALPIVGGAAPLLAPAAIGYAHSVPQNIPPYASQVSIVNRAVSGYVAAPFAGRLASPLVAPVPARYLSSNVAPAFLRSPLAYSVAPGYSSLPLLRTGVAAPYALRTADPLPLAAAPLSYSATPFGYSTSPLAYSAGVHPLQTQAIFPSVYNAVAPVGVAGRVAPAGVPVGIAPAGVPVGFPIGNPAEDSPADDAQEITPELEEDPAVVAGRNNVFEVDPNSESATDIPASSADDATDSAPDRQIAEEPIVTSN